MPPVQSARPVGKHESPEPIDCRCPSCERRSARSAQRLRRKRSSARSILPSFSANSSTERGRCSGSRSRLPTLNGDSSLAQVRSRHSTLHQRLSRSGCQRGTPAVPSRLFAFRAFQRDRRPGTAGWRETTPGWEDVGAERPQGLSASESNHHSISRCLAQVRRLARGNSETGGTGSRQGLESFRE